MTSQPKAQASTKQERKSLPSMSLEEAIRISCAYQERFSEKPDKHSLGTYYNHSPAGGYKRAQTIIKSERLNNEQDFVQTAKKLLNENNISQDFYDKFLDVTSKKAVHKKGKQIRGGIPMPNPKEGEVLMKSHGKPDYRKDSSLLPRPELTPQASANRNKKPANLRLYEDFLQKVDIAASEVSMTRTAWIEEAIQEKLVSQRKLKM